MDASLRGEVTLCDEGLQRYREALEVGRLSGDVPSCLTEYRLVRPLLGRTDSFVPVPPRVAESEVSRPMQRKIEKYQGILTSLHSSFHAADLVYRNAHLRAEPSIEPLSGEAVIGEALRLAVASCKDELLTAQPGGGRAPELLGEALPRDLALLRRGVRQRTLYQHSVRSHQPTLTYIERVLAEGAKVRTLEEIFERVIICDRSVAFIPGSPERHTAALAIRHTGIVDFLIKVFEHMWDRAQTVSITMDQYRPDLLTDSVRRTVLRMVVAGHTDESIAARLGVSTRTVSTHIKKVSDALGSRSRAELGFLVSQRRLLEQERPLSAAAEGKRRGVSP